MGKYDGIYANKKIYINKTYKNTLCANKTKMHTMVVSDSHKDQTGTWINDGTYALTWFDNNDYSVGEQISINSILKVHESRYTNRQGQFVSTMILTVAMNKGQNVNNNPYGNYQQPQYQQPNNEQYQAQYKQPSYNPNDDYDY